jgi:hypothetical protein
MRAEIVFATPGISMAGGPMTRILHVRVDNMVYVVHLLSYREPSTRSQITVVGYRRDNMDMLFTHIPYEDDTFALAARQMCNEEAADLFVLIDGEREPVDFKQLREIETATKVEPVWCPVANMVRERPYGLDGRETRRGSKHFAPGAKLYCFPALWGDGYKQIQVIGRHRATHRYVKMIVNEKWLTNWRVQLAYSPHVIRELWPTWDGTQHSHERAQGIVDFMTSRVMERERQMSSGGGE